EVGEDEAGGLLHGLTRRGDDPLDELARDRLAAAHLAGPRRDLGAVRLERGEHLAEASRDVFPGRRREAHGDVAIHLRHARLDATDAAILHAPGEDALAAIDALLGLA